MSDNLTTIKLYLKLKTIYEDIKYNENNYICNCSHYDFSNKEYKYWENRNVTSDEIIIVKYIKSLNLRSNLNILHVGIGNSYIYEQLNKSHIISGITISNQK